MEILAWIQHWYKEHCNGDWEHSYGMQISTLDNPGWAVKISLEDTGLQDIKFPGVEVDRSDNDWMTCKIGFTDEREGIHFLGYGGPGNLEEILITFKKAVEEG